MNSYYDFQDAMFFDKTRDSWRIFVIKFNKSAPELAGHQIFIPESRRTFT